MTSILIPGEQTSSSWRWLNLLPRIFFLSSISLFHHQVGQSHWSPQMIESPLWRISWTGDFQILWTPWYLACSHTSPDTYGRSGLHSEYQHRSSGALKGLMRIKLQQRLSIAWGNETWLSCYSMSSLVYQAFLRISDIPKTSLHDTSHLENPVKMLSGLLLWRTFR